MKIKENESPVKNIIISNLSSSTKIREENEIISEIKKSVNNFEKNSLILSSKHNVMPALDDIIDEKNFNEFDEDNHQKLKNLASKNNSKQVRILIFMFLIAILF